MFDNQLTQSQDTETSVFDKVQNKKRSLWNVSQVAEFLGVSTRTIRDWVYKRAIPFRKAGKSVRFDPLEIERWTLPNKE